MTMYVQINKDLTIARAFDLDQPPQVGTWFEAIDEEGLLNKAKAGHVVIANIQPSGEDVDYAHLELRPDHRGQVAYGTTTGAEVKISYIGDLHDNHTLDPRPSPHHTWVDDAWVLDQAAYTQAQIARGEQFVEQHIQAAVATVNQAGVNGRAVHFADINALAKYALLETSQLHEISKQLLSFADQVWQVARGIQADTLSGKREMPSEDALISELPKFEYDGTI